MRVTSALIILLCVLAGVAQAGHRNESTAADSTSDEAETSSSKLHFTTTIMLNLRQGSLIFSDYRHVIATVTGVDIHQVTVGDVASRPMEGKEGMNGWHISSIPTSVIGLADSQEARHRVETDLRDALLRYHWQLEHLDFDPSSPPPPPPFPSFQASSEENYDGAMGGCLALVVVVIVLLLVRISRRNAKTPPVVTARVSTPLPSTVQQPLPPLRASMVFSAGNEERGGGVENFRGEGANGFSQPAPSAPQLWIPPPPIVGVLTQVCLSVSLYVCLSVSISPSLCLSLCLSVRLCVSVSES